MPELSYTILVWLAYRLAATFAVGLPLVIIIWAAFRKEASMVRLLSIYWKVASLMGISMLLLTNQRPIGYLTFFIAPFLMIGSIWFWVDLNEELADLPPWRPLPFTVRLWRWALSGFCVIFASLTFLSLPCIKQLKALTALLGLKHLAFCIKSLKEYLNFSLEGIGTNL